jgi:hypothetical protein
MSISLILFLTCAAFVVFAIYSLYKVDRRRWDRRQRKMFLPTQRRKESRRRTGLSAHFGWAMRTHASMFAISKPQAQVLPKRKSGPKVKYD